MGRPKLYADAAARKAAQRTRSNVTQQADNVTPNVTLDVTKPDNVTQNVTIEGVTIENEQVDEAETMEGADDPDADEIGPASACLPSAGFVQFRDQPQVPRDSKADPWIGAGRGTVREYKGASYVLVARGTPDPNQPEHGVVSAADWHARLAQHCPHGLAGWSCHAC